jgi:hypothetical protein
MRITFKHMDKSLSVKIFLPRFEDMGGIWTASLNS